MKLFSKKNIKDSKGKEKEKEKIDDNKKNCKYCDMVFEGEDRLKRHIRKAHNEKNSDMPNFNPFGT